MVDLMLLSILVIQGFHFLLNNLFSFCNCKCPRLKSDVATVFVVLLFSGNDNKA